MRRVATAAPPCGVTLLNWKEKVQFVGAGHKSSVGEGHKSSVGVGYESSVGAADETGVRVIPPEYCSAHLE